MMMTLVLLVLVLVLVLVGVRQGVGMIITISSVLDEQELLNQIMWNHSFKTLDRLERIKMHKRSESIEPLFCKL
jgi:hypothetical protein